MIAVGTIGKGPSGPPLLRDMHVDQKLKDQQQGDAYLSDASDKLADLPVLLDEVSYAIDRKDVIAFGDVESLCIVDDFPLGVGSLRSRKRCKEKLQNNKTGFLTHNARFRNETASIDPMLTGLFQALGTLRTNLKSDATPTNRTRFEGARH
jgi:hypothetical protein